MNATDPDSPASGISIHCDWDGGPTGKTFPSGTTNQLFSVGNHSAVCSATDPAANTSAAVSFAITVTPYVDTTPPVIQVVNVTAPATSAAGTTVFETVLATDDSPGVIAVTCDHNVAGGVFPIGVTTVVCNAHDAANNQASASFTVTVTSTGSTPGATTTSSTTTLVTTTTVTKTTTVTTTSATTVTTPSAVTPAAPKAPGGSSRSQLPTVSLSAAAVTIDAGGKQQLSFSINLSSAASLAVALVDRSGKSLLHFDDQAAKGRAHISRLVPGHALKRGSRLTLKVTVTRHGQHRSYAQNLSVR